jgi:hypothetical protein
MSVFQKNKALLNFIDKPWKDITLWHLPKNGINRTTYGKYFVLSLILVLERGKITSVKIE